MKRIACPIDFSEAANNAVDYAANLTKYFGAELVLLHIVQEPLLKSTASVTNVLPLEARVKTAEERLQEYKEMVQADYSILCSISVKSDISNVTNALKKEIENEDYDLIIMGTNGAEDLNQFYFGSHTYKVIKKISKPLILVPEGHVFTPLEKIIYASDYNREDVAVLNSLVDLTKTFDAQITVLHFIEHATQNGKDIFLIFQELYKDHVKDDQMEFEHIVSKEPAESLDDYMHKNNADLLVLTTHQYSFLERIFHDSVTRRLALIANYPILVYHTSS